MYDTFDITVVNVNDAPTEANAIPDQVGTQGTSYTLTIPSNTFSDVDIGDT